MQIYTFLNSQTQTQVFRKVLKIHLYVPTGGGVTVKYAHHLMNLLTVRRARPRLLVEGPQGTTFHPDVAEVDVLLMVLLKDTLSLVLYFSSIVFIYLCFVFIF